MVFIYLTPFTPDMMFLSARLFHCQVYRGLSKKYLPGSWKIKDTFGVIGGVEVHRLHHTTPALARPSFALISLPHPISSQSPPALHTPSFAPVRPAPALPSVCPAPTPCQHQHIRATPAFTPTRVPASLFDALTSAWFLVILFSVRIHVDDL